MKFTTRKSDIFGSKFIITIKVLDETELKSFEAWLKSPWCNTNKNLIRLFEKIKKYYPDFDNPKLSKEKLFQQILPNGKFSARRMNNLLSEAYLSVERFLTFQSLSQDQNLQKDLLTKEFQNRHLEDWFFRDADKEIDRLEAKPIKDWEDHLALLQLHRRVYHHPNQNPRMKPGGTTIIRMGEEIDLVFLLEKAAIINEKIFRNRILKNENHEIAEELKKWRTLSEGIEHPAITFYRMRFEYTEDNMLEQYYVLRKAFLEGFEALNEKEQKVHFVSLLNDTIALIRAGFFDITETLELYKLGLKFEIILHQNMLTYNRYATIVSASNAKRDFEFTNYFLNTYTKKIDEKFQLDAYNWAQAHTTYSKEEFIKTLDILLDYDFKVHFFQLLSKVLTTQVYFDLFLADESYQSYLFTYFDAFEKWLLREKTHSKFNKKAFLRFIQLCRSLAKHFSSVNFQVKKVEILLKNENNIQASNWLCQKKEQVIKIKTEGLSKR